jgi:L,D-transpeptidase catalytic domain
MVRVPRLLTHVAAAVAALVLILAFPADARADPDAGWASIPTTGPAYVPNVNPAYVPNRGPVYAPNVDPAYVPDTRPAPIPNADWRYIYVSKQSPERLYLIGGGKIIFQSPVNTGIRAAPTPDGVFHIFASYLQKTMKGTDPRTFRRYDDRNVPYVMYFDGGLAIHGFHRTAMATRRASAASNCRSIRRASFTGYCRAVRIPKLSSPSGGLYSSAAAPRRARTGWGGTRREQRADPPYRADEAAPPPDFA